MMLTTTTRDVPLKSFNRHIGSQIIGPSDSQLFTQSAFKCKREIENVKLNCEMLISPVQVGTGGEAFDVMGYSGKHR